MPRQSTALTARTTWARPTTARQVPLSEDEVPPPQGAWGEADTGSQRL